MTSPGHRGPATVPSWVLAFNDVVERVWFLLRINAMWSVLTLLGLGVLGLAPASSAAADALLAARDGDRVAVASTMWRSYRAQFLRVNLRMGPLVLVQIAAAVMLWLLVMRIAPSVMTIPLAAAAAISLAWATVSLATITAVPRLRRQDLLVTWRIALLMPGALPSRAIGLVLLLAIWTVISSTIWPIGVLLGAAVGVDLAVSFLGRRADRLLRELDTLPETGEPGTASPGRS